MTQPSREEQAEAYIEHWNEGHLEVGPPIHAAMGIRIRELIPKTVVEIELKDAVRGMLPGSIHGGLLATLIDVACAISVWDQFDSSAVHPATTDLHVRYFRQPSGGTLTCEVDVAHAGRRLLSTEAKVTDEGGRLIATGTASFALVERLW